ncbi:MAG TPA: SAM-dependent methyltransferase, partial [Streptomyces sp.]|nr:SAM-dependent methyltransferase [Streptomyces sp.]
RRWRAAMEDALYGPDGFFVREAPGAHFRTSVHASPLFARAVAELLRRVDAALGEPEEVALVDVGAGRGELLAGVLRVLDADADADAAADGTGLARRLRPCAVERAARPGGLDARVEWRDGLPAPGSVTGLLFANEWLDDVPVDVAEADADGTARYVLVDAAGAESPGEPVRGADADWLAAWWPLDDPQLPACRRVGRRAEIGLPRDEAWAAAVGTLRRGVAVAADYAHRRAERPQFGTLAGYRDGRQVRPVPDGTRDLTAHVALDACAARTGGPAELLSQRDALHALGLDGRRPPLSQATQDPAGYVRALAAAGQAAELTDPEGLGGFGWLVQPVGVPAPLSAPRS